ncbi:MAG: preprotein translocase subunit SecG [Rhodospirillales bacterium]|nr:MAG: preprotein translocase subunit SecG [Rhodospirillales bacterium]
MQYVVLTIHVMIAIALVIVVLLQRSEGGGLGMGRSDSFMSIRGQGTVLTRGTAILAAGFFVTSIGLAFIGGTHSRGAFMDGGKAPAGKSGPATPGAAPGASPATPPAPTTPTR